MIVAELRKLETQVLQGEISYSRMVEIINEKIKSDAVEFAEYLDSNWYFIRRDRIRKGWVNIVDNIVLVHGSESHYNKLLEFHGKTTSEVYAVFKQSK